MTLDEAFEGHEVSRAEAERELRAHGFTLADYLADCPACCRTSLNSRCILQWLGY